MVKRIKNSINLFRNMGWHYVAFRSKHELLMRTGLLKNKFPVNPADEGLPTITEWRATKVHFFFDSKESIKLPRNPNQKLQQKYLDLLSGKLTFFSSIHFDLGKDYDWVTNPDNGFVYDNKKHWTAIADFSREAGDIKYVWEKSRFSFLYDIIRYDYHFNCDCSELVFKEILSWIDHNPINCGPNYRCSQEISLRVLNWIFALYYYKNSPVLTDDVFQKLMYNIYWQIKHVYSNIHFSRIAVRNNHAITETLGLYLFGILFPFFPEAGRWKKDGKKWFEQEVSRQVYADGTYLQFSMNYHRVVVQLLTWGIRLSELNNEILNKAVKDRAAASLHFLFNCMNLPNGHLPNYGANDGALFFPLNDQDFRDYRPQLHALSALIKQGRIEENNEDQFWYGINEYDSKILVQKQGMLTFPIGGFYLLREKDSFSFIRCGRHKDRPIHADNLHLDIWVNGKNILRDSGSFKYNTDKKYQAYFTGTESHNTVVVGDHSQMLKGGRFIWFYWSQAKCAEWSESTNDYTFQGAISAFRFLNPKAIHQRTVVKRKDRLEWVITDKIKGLPNFKKKQIWHHDKHRIDFEAFANKNEKAKQIESISYNSNYYGVKKEGTASAFVFDSEISTTIKIVD
jgi:hypothetical protein